MRQYQPEDRVVKKSVRFGVLEGVVLKSWLQQTTYFEAMEEQLLVYWTHSHRKSCIKASAVLPATPENMGTLEERRLKQLAQVELEAQS